MGYDNARGVAPLGSRYSRRQTAFDHWHRDERDQGRPYRFVDAERLIGDFFDDISRIIREWEP